MVTAGILPFRENSHGRTGNRTRDLMISSQRLWPLDHEAGLFQKYYPGKMTGKNLKKFEILSEGDANMAGKAEIELRGPSLLTSRNTIKSEGLNQSV